MTKNKWIHYFSTESSDEEEGSGDEGRPEDDSDVRDALSSCICNMALWDCSHVDLSFQDWEEDEAAMEVTEDKMNHKDEEGDEEEDMNDESKANGGSDLDPENESEEE